jgi:DNA invertase Pin-like site-specific DNA recombinase
MVALGYIRRSKESGARTISLEDQRARIADYCRAQGWPLAEVLADDGVSGGRRERLERLALRVNATGARVVVVYHLDRFARDLAGTLDYLRRFSRRGVELHVVGRGRIEADTASGFIVTAVEGLAAEHYRRVISEKTRDALARLRTQGRRISRFAPYGWRVGPEGRLVPDPAEQVTRRRILALAGAGRSLRALSAELARRGIVGRSGQPFAPASLWRIVSNRGVGNSRATASRRPSPA